ncbi:hypothetical protein QC761_206484 [Podospora bellae-mahoneyi]|uniref:Uncharacterized protein n=1 Tax=Podospora bellae-mahoneyi TaxID=2093777 RepID=A0ABR0FPV4_9PEZI|nr:hypothetical protein QC761_206484 [Podospora bellae-mahoneyi]
MEQKQDPEEHPYTKRHDFRINSHVLPSPFGETYGYAYCGKWARERGVGVHDYQDDSGSKDWPYDKDYEEDYSYADLPSLQRRNPHLPLDDDEYNGPIVVAGSVQLSGEETPQEYIAKISDSAYYPVSWDMECRKRMMV